MLLNKLGSRFFVTLVLVLSTPNLLANETATQIKEAVSQFLLEHENSITNRDEINGNKPPIIRVESEVGYVDKRLKLSPCPSTIDVKFNNPNATAGRLTTKVSCSSGQQWSLYVPVTIKQYQTVVVALQPIPRGMALQQEQLGFEEKEISSLYRGYYVDNEALLGYVTTRSIKSHEVITPNNLTAPKLVYRNEEVTIIAKTGGLQVRATGIALSDGKLGQKISVRNKITKKVIEARVKAPGRVEIQI